MPPAQVIRIERHMTNRRRVPNIQPRSECEIVQLFRAPAHAVEAQLAKADDDLLSGRGRDAG
jgi:hypothetical protein